MTSQVIVKAHCASNKMAVMDVLLNGDLNYTLVARDGAECQTSVSDGQTVTVREVVIAEYEAAQQPDPTAPVPPTAEAELEAYLRETGKTAPRLTPEHIDQTILGAQFWVPEGTTLTICAMKTNSGYMVTGESACASPENFDAEVGKQIAYKNAREKIWALEGYLLCDRLSNTSN